MMRLVQARGVATGAIYFVAFCGSAVVLAEAAPGRYVLDMPGVVYDTQTKLAWQRNLPGSYMPSCSMSRICTWEEANIYCSQLEISGMTGWRLPTRSELLTLVDRTEVNPPIDQKAFPATPLGSFWSSTPPANASTSKWYVDFTRGFSDYINGDSKHVRCVQKRNSM
jgi:hypothetical protein